MRRIGLMGGSFNPIHNGHIQMARAALQSGWVDRVFFLPTGNPPHKHAELADKMDRLRMVELAIAGEPDMDVCRAEIDREGVIYTVDTLRLLTAARPDTHFAYLIGADTLRVLDTWKEIDAVIALCSLLAVYRPGEDMRQMAEQIALWESRGAKIHMLPMPPMEISSTEVRRQFARSGEAKNMVPDAVAAYIREHGLYESRVRSERMSGNEA